MNIDKEKIKIESMPKYGRYIVVSYGHIVKSKSASGVPECCIVIRKIDKNNNIIGEDNPKYIPLPELDIVRIGTIWEDQYKIENNYSAIGIKQIQKMIFEFDFTKSKKEVISYTDFIEELGTSISLKYKCNFNSMYRKTREIFNKSTFTKLTDANGKIILTPSMEFFTSTFLPKHKELRTRILSYNVDKAILKYLHIDKCNSTKDLYTITLKKGMDFNNVVFIGFSKFNENTRDVLRKLWNSLEFNTQDKDQGYPARYPYIIPWHPKSLAFEAEGVWLNQNVFLSLKILARDLPISPKILAIEDIIKYTKKENKVPPKEPKDKEEDDSFEKPDRPSPIGVDSSNTPFSGNYTMNIKSEIRLLGKPTIRYKKNIESKEITLNVEDKELEPEEYDETKKTENNDGSLSSGETDGSQDNSSNVKFEVDSRELNEETTSKFKKLIDVLDTMVEDEKCNVQKYNCLNESFTRAENITKTFFYYTLHSSNLLSKELSKNSWLKLKYYIKNKDSTKLKKEFRGYRAYLLIEILLTNDKKCYILEIGKKDSERIAGLIIYNSSFEDIDNSSLLNILFKVVNAKGVSKLSYLPNNIKIKTYTHKLSKNKDRYSDLEKKLSFNQ